MSRTRRERGVMLRECMRCGAPLNLSDCPPEIEAENRCPDCGRCPCLARDVT